MARFFSGITGSPVLGNGDFLNCGGATGSLSVANNAKIAISAWVNVFTFPTGTGVATIASKGYDGTVTCYQLVINGPGASPASSLLIDSYDGVLHNAAWAYSGWSTGTWVHLYGDYDGANWHVAFNGVIKNTTADATGPKNSATPPFYIGAAYNNGPTVSNFNGAIADVAVWSTNLSVSEILALAKGARPFNIRWGSIIGYWPITGLQSPEPDLSGFSHNGTVTATTPSFGPPIMAFTPRWPQGATMMPPPGFTLMPQIVT